MNPKIYILQPTYRKESGLWVKDLKPEAIHLSDQSTVFSEVSVVYLPPWELGGNHQHPRIELFAALGGKLELVWQDEQQKTRTLLMQSQHDAEITFYLIPPNLPHAVHNIDAGGGYLLEFASEVQRDVEAVLLR